MIPRLPPNHPPDSAYQAYLDALRAAGFRGEIHCDLARRVLAGTDNSIYQFLPQAVLEPVDQDDVVRVMRLLDEPRFHAIAISPRGGGTGTNAQSLTDGVVLDLSRHMTGIGEANPEAGWVDVEPGVVLDALNDALRPSGRFFAPTLSPSDRATIGGMIATDAAGKGSRIYGKTGQHVIELDVVLMGGQIWTFGTTTDRELRALARRDDAVGRIHRTILETIDEHLELIDERFPDLTRYMTGYNLARVRQTGNGAAAELGADAGATWNLPMLLAGSEGTLGVATRARLRTLALPKHRRIVALAYGAFDDALTAGELIERHDPLAIETMDETLLDLARGDEAWGLAGPVLRPPVGSASRAAVELRAVNLVEFVGDDEQAVHGRAERLAAEVNDNAGEAGRPIFASIAVERDQQAALWNLRKRAVGMLGRLPGARKPVAFVEDCAVPPSALPSFVAGFREILDGQGLKYGMFGHIDVGCLHVRPALDMTDPEDQQRVRAITDEVVELARSHGGLLWGEHGKGVRGEFNPHFMGRDLYELMRTIKGAFDPRNQLNPGKLATPSGDESAALLTIESSTRGELDRQIEARVRAQFADAINCNGNGQCHSYDPDYVMCPSSKVTRDRIHSPKGRATAMRDWLRRLQSAGHELPSEPTGPRLAALPGRAFNSLRKRLGGSPDDDYSHELYDAMLGCLACKACATQCPVNVDVPAFRAHFLSAYHSRYLRPLRDRAITNLESMLPVMAKAPRLANAMTGNAVAKALTKHIVGMVDAPPLAHPTLHTRLREIDCAPRSAPELLSLPDEERPTTVVLLPDAFTSFYTPGVVVAAIELLRAMGRSAAILPFFPNGKALHIKGELARFRAVASRIAEMIRPLRDAGLMLVGLDPAVTLTYRDEYPAELGPDGEALGVRMIQEAILELLDDPSIEAPTARVRSAHSFTLFPHCTERTAIADSPRQWGRIFRAFGLELDVARVGCCGMCGAYGHERIHLDESRGIFDMSWRPKLDAIERPGVPVNGEGGTPGESDASSGAITTGYSCRSQAKRFAQRDLRHPVEVLAQAVGGASSA